MEKKVHLLVAKYHFNIAEEKNKNPNRSKLRGIFNVCSKSKVTAISGVLDPSQTNKEYEQETDEGKRTALMIVAAQNYFYSMINNIEAVLAEKKGEHSFNHENRMRKLFEDRTLLGGEITDLYAEVERNQRNKVTYRGENGEKYENIKRLARLLMKKNE